MNLLNSLSEAESRKIASYWDELESEFMGLDIEYFRYVYGTACWLQTLKHQSGNEKYFLGVSGAQGSGKSTFSRMLVLTLDKVFDSASLVLSLDDFYLPRKERQRLSEIVHPLLKTRGVPGTHDIDLMQEVLSDAEAGRVTRIPAFDKSLDDRVGFQESDCNKLDYVIIEGWCWGAKPVGENELGEAINSLETNRDRNGAWRRYVNSRLASYQGLFNTDASIFLAVPDMQSVLEWRWQQESELERGSGRMSKKEIQNFIMHFERISQRMLLQMPEEADLTIKLDQNHHVESACLRDFCL
ncbi:MAG: hypothetical protein JKY88_04225 [Pseudomonadales bacterium]|nr:hypothetical protein [Pseudomonadales bacterium]